MLRGWPCLPCLPRASTVDQKQHQVLLMTVSGCRGRGWGPLGWHSAQHCHYPLSNPGQATRLQGPEPRLCRRCSRELPSPGRQRNEAISFLLSFLGTEILQEQPDFGAFHLLFIYFRVIPLLLHVKDMALEQASHLRANTD